MYEREHAPLYASVQIGLIQQSSVTVLTYHTEVVIKRPSATCPLGDFSCAHSSQGVE